jgi:hypothetical protein
MSTPNNSGMAFNPTPASAARSNRVKLLGSVLAIVRFNQRHVRARLQQLSTSGGVMQLQDVLDEAANVHLIFHVGSTTVRTQAEMLRPMWATRGYLQPFRFVGLSDEERRRLGSDLEILCSRNNRPPL